MPGPVEIGDAGGNTRFWLLEFCRVDIEIAGSPRQNLEQALGTGKTDLVRVEATLLVHLGNDQPPIETGRRGLPPHDVVIRGQRELLAFAWSIGVTDAI